MSQIKVEGFEEWLARLVTQPLPAGVSAAAMAGSMGAALVAKVARITLAQGVPSGQHTAELERLMALAGAQQVELLHLAHRDELAFRAVLETRDLPAGAPERQRAWQEAIEVPILVAEASALLLGHAASFPAICRRSIHTDLQVGIWLLALGLRAGLQAADSNLFECGEGPQVRSFQIRIQVLKEGKLD